MDVQARARELRRRARLAASNVQRGTEGLRFGRQLPAAPAPGAAAAPAPPDPLTGYFREHTEGPGLWKFWHYFPVYHRHLAKFVGREVHVVEIGIYSGGSLDMWSDYFGEGCHVHGVDIAPETRVYAERDRVDVWIGDQADPAFWERFVAGVPRVDVVVDDGGHQAHQQIATLKGLLAHMAPGGVFICEDVAGRDHAFHSFVDGLTRNLSDFRTNRAPALPIHQHVASVHRYPLVTVIEKPDAAVREFAAPRHGTEWQPFDPRSSDRLGKARR